MSDQPKTEEAATPVPETAPDATMTDASEKAAQDTTSPDASAPAVPAADATATPADPSPDTAATTTTPTADAIKEEEKTEDKIKEEEEEEEVIDEATQKIIHALAERLYFFFSNANLRQDKWMRHQLDQSGCLTLDNLLRFHTIKKISSDKKLIGKAAQSESVKSLIRFDEKRGEVRRVIPFDWKTMGDGSYLSLYVKNVPLTKPEVEPEEKKVEDVKMSDDAKEGESKEEKKEGNGSDAKTDEVKKEETDVKMEDDATEKKEEKPADAKEVEVKEEKKTDTNNNNNTKQEERKQYKRPFKPRYAVTRDDIKKLFEPYGRVGIVTMRYGRREDNNSRYNNRGYQNHRGGESYPLGVAIVEFENKEGLEKACKDLIAQPEENTESAEAAKSAAAENAAAGGEEKEGEEKKEGEEGDKAESAEKEEVVEKKMKPPVTVLEIEGNKLKVETMKPPRWFTDQQRGNDNGKRSRDSEGGNDRDDNRRDEPMEEIKFEPVTLDWEKGCVVALTGLSTTTCDREAIRDAVSDILGVTTDVKTSGLYVDYNRGASSGHLRLKEPKPEAMKELVAKLNDGTVKIANEKVGEATFLEGEAEEKYWKDFLVFLNNRKRMRDEEKRMTQQRFKRQRFGGRGGGGGGRGGGRGGVGRGRGRGGGGRGGGGRGGGRGYMRGNRR